MSKLQKFGVVPDETRYVYNKSKDYEEFTMSASHWSKAILENKALVHIDFSFNQFVTQDIKIIGNCILSLRLIYR